MSRKGSREQLQRRQLLTELAAKQQQEHDDVMQALARLSMSREEQRQGDQAQAASITGGEVGNPASPSQVLPSAAQGEGVVPVEVGPRADRFGESGQDRDYGLTGESARYVSRRSHVPPMKIPPPTLKDREGFRIFQAKGGTYAKYHSFDGVLESEPYLDVGGSMSKEEFMRQEICLLYTSPSPRDRQKSRMPSSA